MTASDGTGIDSETLSGLIEFSAAVVGGDSGGAAASTPRARSSA